MVGIGDVEDVKMIDLTEYNRQDSRRRPKEYSNVKSDLLLIKVFIPPCHGNLTVKNESNNTYGIFSF
jgi:hypothetical protein